MQKYSEFNGMRDIWKWHECLEVQLFIFETMALVAVQSVTLGGVRREYGKKKRTLRCKKGKINRQKQAF